MSLFDDLIPAGGGGGASAGIFDDLIPTKKGLIEKAIEPVTTYPGVQSEMANAAFNRMSEGVGQIRSGIDLAMSPERRAAMSETEQAGAGPLTIAKGVGNVAAGGLEYVASPISAAYRTLVGQPVENVTGIPKEYTEFGAMLATPGLGLTRLPKAPPSVPVAAPLKPGEEVAAAGQRLGIDLPRAVTSDTQSTQQMGKVLTNIPFAGTPIRRASDAAIQGIGDAATAVKEAYGSGNVNNAGTAAREGVTEFLKSGPIKQRVNELYDRVDGLVNPTVIGELPNTRNAVNTINGRRVNAALPESKAAGGLDEALGRQGMNYEGIKDLRTHYGEMLDGSQPIPEGMSHGEVKQIYGALSKDMRLIIAKAGGEEGLRVYQQAENAAARWAGIREDLSRILKVHSEEGIFDRIAAMAGTTARADLNMLGRVRGAVGADKWDEIASAVIGRMGFPQGGTGFSPDAFLKAYKKLSPEGKRLLFRSTGNSAHADAIDDIAKVSERFKELNRFSNPSGTGQTVAGYEELTGMKGLFSGNFVEPLSTVGAILGGRILARVLARPLPARTMANWAKDYAAYAAKKTPATMSKLEASTKIFAAAIGKDFRRPDLVPDLMRRLQGAVPSPAQQEQPEAPGGVGDQP